MQSAASGKGIDILIMCEVVESELDVFIYYEGGIHSSMPETAH